MCVLEGEAHLGSLASFSCCFPESSYHTKLPVEMQSSPPSSVGISSNQFLLTIYVFVAYTCQKSVFSFQVSFSVLNRTWQQLPSLAERSDRP